MLNFIKEFNKAFALAGIVGWVFGIYFMFQMDHSSAILAWSIPTGIGVGESISRIFIEEN